MHLILMLEAVPLQTSKVRLIKFMLLGVEQFISPPGIVRIMT